MKGFFSMFRTSAKEMLTVRGICVMAMLIAIHLFIKTFTTIAIGPTIRISFSFLALASIGMILGPTAGMCAGLITDVLGFFFANKNGGAFHPGFTLVQVLAGLFYGLCLYKARVCKDDKTSMLKFILRCAVCEACIAVFCNLLLNTFFLSQLYGKGYFAMLPARIIKNAVQLPVDVVLMAAVLPVVGVAYDKIFSRKSRSTPAV
ncbi:MAG: folate family ECF transporter S component [Huintestinicola sp.]